MRPLRCGRLQPAMFSYAITQLMPSDVFKFGSLGEWFKPAVLKTAEQQCSVSSNLTASASEY
jgi:hypothetical protein